MPDVTVMELKVRGYHLDLFGVVNHARYVEFMEEGRWRYLEQRPRLASDLHAAGVVHSVVNLNIDYRRPARLGDVLRLETRLGRATGRSITFSQGAWLADSETPALEGEVTNVFFRAQGGEVVSTADPVFAAWEELQRMI